MKLKWFATILLVLGQWLMASEERWIPDYTFEDQEFEIEKAHGFLMEGFFEEGKGKLGKVVFKVKEIKFEEHNEMFAFVADERFSFVEWLKYMRSNFLYDELRQLSSAIARFLLHVENGRTNYDAAGGYWNVPGNLIAKGFNLDNSKGLSDLEQSFAKELEKARILADEQNAAKSELKKEKKMQEALEKEVQRKSQEVRKKKEEIERQKEEELRRAEKRLEVLRIAFEKKKKREEEQRMLEEKQLEDAESEAKYAEKQVQIQQQWVKIRIKELEDSLQNVEFQKQELAKNEQYLKNAEAAAMAARKNVLELKKKLGHKKKTIRYGSGGSSSSETLTSRGSLSDNGFTSVGKKKIR